MNNKNTPWEASIHRPYLGADWSCLEQQGTPSSSDTSFVRYGKDHHEGETKSFWISLCEFNPNHWKNVNTGYNYTVRGSVNTKPKNGIKYFNSIKEAMDYMKYIAESTDEHINIMNSDETILAYEKRKKEISKMSGRKEL